MSACWPLGPMHPSCKSVLISLADNSNDEGVCWPSVATIARRTCLSERGVQSAIKALQEMSILERDMRFGRSTVYTIIPSNFNPRSDCTPAVTAPEPPQSQHPTPAVTAPRTIKEPKREPSNKAITKKQSGFDPLQAKPENLSQDVWEGFCKMRKAKRATLTERACELIAKKLAGLSQDQADEVVDRSTANSWTDVYADKAAGSKSVPVSSTRPPLKEGQFYHPEWDAGNRIICTVGRHDPETGYLLQGQF